MAMAAKGRRHVGGGLLLALAGMAAGCGGAGAAPKSMASSANACARRHPGVGAIALDAKAAGSTVVLARLGDRDIAYVADEDARAVRVLDVDAAAQGKARELSSTPLGGTPSQLLVTADGRVVVTLRDRSELRVLEPTANPEAPLEARCSVPTPTEPVALAPTPDGKAVLVSSGWGATLTAFGADDLAERWRAPLPREPRAVVVSDDGRKAFVSHVVGSRMSVVDLTSASHPVRNIDLTGVEKGTFRGGLMRSLSSSRGEEVDRSACQGFALAKTVEPKGRILAPQVLVDPGDTEERAGGYGNGGMVPVEVADVAVVDDVTDEPLRASLTVTPELRGGPGARGACLLPRAAAVDGKSGTLLVACMGVDALVEYDAAAADPHRAEVRRWSVPAGPTGLAIDAQARRAVVWSQFDRALAVVPLTSPDVAGATAERVATAKFPTTADSPEAAELALGRKLFHTSDARISSDGRACASCHPDGRDDAITWATPEGPRQTPMLAGRIQATAPYGWGGTNKDVHEHLRHTFERLGGSSLPPAELQALVSYATRLGAPVAGRDAGGALAERGKAIFHSAQAGCATCHSGAETTDGAAHDIASRTKADVAAGFETPSLRFVGGTAPYFHDGRYATLRALLVDAEGDMGHTKHLSSADLAALEAYLRSL
jgi:DNA-binding beta-propeller fold protein YncE